MKREAAARSAVVAKFFYSDREDELQRNHYSMLRSILYDILRQDEAFFYHGFQSVYRHQRHGTNVNWEYESLKIALKPSKTIPKLPQRHSLVKRLYLIIDAVDESEDNDRRNILELLFQLCAEGSNFPVVKVFVASRPARQLEVRKSQFHNFIRLQDETKPDISGVAISFLNRLTLKHLLGPATKYIVENAQGVFMWVKLIGEELLTCEEKGYSEEETFNFLKQLPTDLEAFYMLMFGRMNKKGPDLRDGLKMFRFVLFASRPLTVDELLHALGAYDDPNGKFVLSDDVFQRRTPLEQRIVDCGGNFLEIKPYQGTGTARTDSSNPQG